MPSDKQQPQPPRKEKIGKERTDLFPIVGLGASAGGLEAFTRFFGALPDNPGMAFVLIQHLDPNHESMMSDLLSRHTSLKMIQVRERIRVLLNTVYIIPPGKYLGLEDQHLVLSDQPTNRGMRMTIDHFFKTLAETRREKAICIILSGTASDGTMGMKAVKANGGLAIVQDPESAQYDGMPRSAISTGAVDRILAPEQMPEVLMEYARHPYVNGGGKAHAKAVAEEGDVLEKVLAALHTKTGQEFKGYKKSTIGRRIPRRMSLNHIVSMGDYIQYLRSSKAEAEALFKDLLINVTAFFRDARAWDRLENSVLPKLVDRCDRNHSIRVWTPGCATGEEAYSIAMLLHEMIERRDKRTDIQIFGTDIDKDAFGIARSGRYPASIAADVAPERLDRFFDRDQDFFVVKKQLRESVVFAPQSLINDPPFSNIDLIICRNLLIYLEPDVQFKIIRLFHFALKEDGYLFLGNSETIGNHKDLFEPVSKSWRIYKRLGAGRTANIELPVFRTFRGQGQADEPGTGRRERRMSITTIAQQAVLQRYAPTSVLIDRKLEVLYYQGDTAGILRLPEGEPTRNFIEQASPTMRTKLRWLLHRLMESGEPDAVDDVIVKHEDGTTGRLRIEATPLKHPAEADGLILVAFIPQPEPPLSDSPAGPETRDSSEGAAVQQLEYELKTVREELQSTIEELETSNEELKASNEEAMSMNEELQSTNEELETNKEELQSLNEELTTVNNELREKVRELEEANNDLSNLLANTHIPTIFLTRDLRIKRFTPATIALMRLVSSDIGRRFDHIARRFDDPDLLDDIRTVIRELAPREKEIITDKEHWFVRRVLPYRTQDDRIDGVVITFLDVTQKHRHLDEIKAREDQLRRAIVEAPLPVILFAEDQQILMLSRSWVEITGYSCEELRTLPDWTERAYGARDVEMQAYINSVIEKGERLDEGEFTIRTKGGAARIWNFHSSPLGRLPDGRRLIIGMAIDMTSRRRAEDEVKHKEEQLRKINASLEEQITERTHTLEIKSSQLQRLAAELSQVEQRERRQLASTLHDHLQQLIAAARMRLEGIEYETEASARAPLTEIRKMLEEAAQACRNVSVQLAPPVLYDAGFCAAAQWLCKWFREQHGLNVSCQVEQVLLDQDLSVLLFQSIKELLFNVVKHADHDTAELIIRPDGDDRLLVQVADAGAGFDPAALEGGSGGQGFGLFSIRERIEMVNGHYHLDSSPGRGTVITITVPVRPKDDVICPPDDSPAPPEQPRTERPKARGTGCTRQIRILIVDDHQIFREGLRSLLENHAHIAIIGEAADGPEAVEKALELQPDVILMDINMPGINGIEATRRIIEKQPMAKVIGLSVNPEDEMAEAMLAVGATAYLTKGGPSHELLAVINESCGA